MNLLRLIVLFVLVSPQALFAGKNYSCDRNGFHHFVIISKNSARAQDRRAQKKHDKLVKKPAPLSCKQVGLVLGVSALIASGCLRYWIAVQATK